jgi:hypothetical protein
MLDSFLFYAPLLFSSSQRLDCLLLLPHLTIHS